jgi:ribosome-associated protein
MHALQRLGERLVELDPGRLAELALPERLGEAIAQARGIRQHEARRRQMQFIGRLMREVDPAPIEARFEQWENGPRIERALHRSAEAWRERFLAEAAAIDEFVAAHPGADRTKLRALAQRARTEAQSGEPPRSYRELYRQVRDTLLAPPEGDTA